jgi:arylsulfatase A
MATCADIVGGTLPVDAAEDSISLMPLLRSELDRPVRHHIVHHSAAGRFAIRSDRWVFIDAPSGGENPVPEEFQRARGYRSHHHPGELFDLTDDLPQRHNRYAERPDIVAALAAQLEEIKAAAPTRPV